MDDHGSSFDVSGCVILDGSSSSHKKKKKSKEGDCLNDFDSSVIGLKSTSSIVSDTEDEAKLHKKKKNKSSKKESGMDDHGSSFDVSATDYLDFKRKKSRKEKDVSNESVLNITTDDPQKPSRKKEKNKDLKSGDESMAIDHESLFNTFSESSTTFKRKHKKNEIEDSASEPYTKKIKSADSNDNASDSAMRAQSNETNGGPISSTNTLGVNDKSISAKNNNMSIVGIRDKNVSEVTARNSKSSESQKIRKRALFNANSSFLSFPKAPVKSELSASPEKVRRTLASESDQQRVPQGSSMNVKNELTSPSKEMKGNPSQTMWVSEWAKQKHSVVQVIYFNAEKILPMHKGIQNLCLYVLLKLKIEQLLIGCMIQYKNSRSVMDKTYRVGLRSVPKDPSSCTPVPEKTHFQGSYLVCEFWD